MWRKIPITTGTSCESKWRDHLSQTPAPRPTRKRRNRPAVQLIIIPFIDIQTAPCSQTSHESGQSLTRRRAPTVPQFRCYKYHQPTASRRIRRPTLRASVPAPSHRRRPPSPPTEPPGSTTWPHPTRSLGLPGSIPVTSTLAPLPPPRQPQPPSRRSTRARHKRWWTTWRRRAPATAGTASFQLIWPPPRSPLSIDCARRQLQLPVSAFLVHPLIILRQLIRR